ncbi:MAG: DUF1667 domain-containing protein [Spirochaetia bacterium]
MANTKNTDPANTAQNKDTREMVCIVCPIGCRLKVEVKQAPYSGKDTLSGNTADSESPEVSVSGNKCPRGEAYALEEVLAPKRTVTATCRVTGSNIVRRVPVKTDSALPVEHIDNLLSQLYTLELEAPISIGTTVIENVGGTRIDVLTTRSVAAETIPASGAAES